MIRFTQPSRVAIFDVFFRRFMFVCLLAFGVNAQAAAMRFNIPAQPASSALKAFAKQASVEVLFSFDELKEVQSHAVVGEMEPGDALKQLLDGTGFAAKQTAAKNFVVRKADDPVTTGGVRGSLTGEGGKGLPNVLVAIKETAQSAETDKYGVYVFPNVAAGTYVLVASAPGYQTMHIKDVNVKAGRDLTIGREEMRKAGEGPLALEPFVVHADTVEQLEKFEVTGTKERPFAGANVDIPRTIDDAQPYYIFDSKTINQSGATNIEDFLKQRLTMNAEALTNGQTSGLNVNGNTSSINLRGLGTDKTLILVDGRRMAGVQYQTTTNQPDLNGIPLSAIDRVEVLPSSASGIYGGSAIGGVINIILKKDYVGGEIRAIYDNTWDADSPRRTLTATYGMALEGGKTHVTINASWSDARPLLLEDRSGIFEQNLATVLHNSPNRIYSSINPFLGALPNIAPLSRSQTTLTLLNGTVIPSNHTYVPPGTSASTPASTLYAGLATDGGAWDLALPDSTQTPTGLLRPFGVTPETKSIQASVRRQMLPNLDLFADFSYNSNNTKSVYNSLSAFTVPAGSPLDPFTTTVRVAVPDATPVPVTTQSMSRSFTLGAMAKLPWGWTGEADYSWSQSRSGFHYFIFDTGARSADVSSGALNPFVDTLLFPLALTKYLAPNSYAVSSTLNDLALRGSGPLPALPWGTPTLTVGIEHLISAYPDNSYQLNYPISTGSDTGYLFFSGKQVTASGYGEMAVPLVKAGWLPFVNTLEFQLSGRADRFTVNTGTQYETIFPNNPSQSSYGAPTLNGQPFFARTSYTSTNGTIGLKYQPIPELTLRTSLATAFLPPSPSDLVKNPQVDPSTTTVLDPKTGSSVDVQTISGGNPDLKPQSSKSWNAGIIWEPRASLLKGLRLDVEYYRIVQKNAFGSLDPQTIINQETTFPGRVTRDATGTITLVDTSEVNLFKRDTEGWDFSADYALKTSCGTISLNAVESIISHLKTQYSQSLPEYDAAGYSPTENGAPKYKSNATLTWERRGWTAAWTMRYFSSYKQFGAAGGPDSIQYYGGATDTNTIAAQGSDTIPSQTYHDVYFGYAFGKQRSETDTKMKALATRFLDGLTVQLGMRNIFNKAPPFDANYASNYFESPYGDMRLRSYWVSVKKAF